MSIADINVVREAVSKVTKILAGQHIQVTQRGATAYVSHNPKTGKPERVNLPYIPDNASQSLIDAVNGFLDHEVGHLLVSDFSTLTKANELGSGVKTITNVIEDTFVEREMQRRFRGSAKNLDNLGKFYLDKFVGPKSEEAIAAGDNAMLTSVMAVSAIRAAAGQPLYVDYMKDKWEMVPELKELLDEDMQKRIQSVRSTKDSLELGIEIKNVLYGEDPPESGTSDEDSPHKPRAGKSGTSAPSKKPGHSTKPSSDDTGTGKGKGSEPDDSSGSSSSKPSKGGDEEEPKGSEDEESEEESGGKGEDEDSEDESGGKDEESKDESGDEDEDSEEESEPEEEPDEEESEPEPEEEPDEEESEEPSEDEEKEKERPKLDPSKMAMMEDHANFDDAVGAEISKDTIDHSKAAPYLVYSKDFDIIGPPKSEVKNYKTGMIEDMDKRTKAIVGPLQKNIERLIMAQKKSRWQPGLRSGKINAASLFKLKTGDDRVFRQRHIEGESRDVAISVVMDLSGSMSGSKVKTATLAGYALASTLSKLGVKFELIGFTTKNESLSGEDRKRKSDEEAKMGRRYSRSERIYMPVFKGFDETFTVEQKKRMSIAAEYISLNNNIDGESIEYAAMRLMKQTADKHMMIVLSDGQPACYGDHNAVDKHLGDTVKTLIKMGIDMFGIGIESQAVKDYYPKYVTLDSVNELPAVLMAKLKDTFVNKGK